MLHNPAECGIVQDRVSGLRYMAGGAWDPATKPFCPHALNADRICTSAPPAKRCIILAPRRYPPLSNPSWTPAVTWYLRCLAVSADWARQWRGLLPTSNWLRMAWLSHAPFMMRCAGRRTRGIHQYGRVKIVLWNLRPPGLSDGPPGWWQATAAQARPRSHWTDRLMRCHKTRSVFFA